jgi:hypothetical protein
MFYSIDGGKNFGIAYWEVTGMLLRYCSGKVLDNKIIFSDDVCIDKKIDYLVVEQPLFNYKNRRSRKSMITFGYNIGRIVGFFDFKKIYFIHPNTWKSFFNLSKNKQDSIDLVNKIYGLDLKNHNVAEAILLGKYFYENHQR